MNYILCNWGFDCFCLSVLEIFIIDFYILGLGFFKIIIMECNLNIEIVIFKKVVI